LEIGGVRYGTASATMVTSPDAFVLTAGHACVSPGAEVRFRASDDTWNSLGVVQAVKNGATYFDAGVISTKPGLVDPKPLGLDDPLVSYKFDDLPQLRNRRCEVFLGFSRRWLSGTITKVVFDGTDNHLIEFTPDQNEAPGTNGDSGSALIVFDAGLEQLAGIFVRLPAGQNVMQFLHPTPALNALGVPIP
jgi:hypothetical protein